MIKMLRKKLLPIISVVFLTACAGEGTIGTKTVKDLAGVEVSIPSHPERIVCRSGNGTSFLVAMGLEDRLVGTANYMLPNPWVDYFCPRIKDIPGFAWEPSAEELFATNTDLVMLPDPLVAESLRTGGLTAVTYKQYNIGEILSSVDFLKNVFDDNQSKSFLDDWLSYYHETINYVEKQLKDIKEEDRLIVHYVYAASNKGPTRSVGGGGIYESWAEQSGMSLATKQYPAENKYANEEELLKIDPDIIMIGGNAQEDVYDALLVNTTWSGVKALKNNKVFRIPVGFLSWDMYGIEYPLWVLWTAKQVYPDLIEKDIAQETYSFYKKFYNKELSNTHLNNLLNGKSPDGRKLNA